MNTSANEIALIAAVLSADGRLHEEDVQRRVRLAIKLHDEATRQLAERAEFDRARVLRSQAPPLPDPARDPGTT